MADENEIKALADRFYAVAVASEGTDYMTAWDAAQHAAREALRWRDETRPLQAPPAAAVAAENVTPMRQPRHDLERLVNAIKSTVHETASGLSVTEAIGALELAKLELFKEQEK